MASGHGPRGRLARGATTIAVVLGVLLSVLVTSPAQAATEVTGYGQGVRGGFLGAYRTEADGRQAYCTDLGLPSATAGASTGPSTVSALAGVSDVDVARLDYVLARWGQSDDPHLTAAVALFVWSITSTRLYDTHPGISGDNFYVARAPRVDRPAILAALATMRSESTANARASASVSMSIAMNDARNGVVTVTADPVSVIGTVTLHGATFADGSRSATIGAGSHPIVGTPDDGATAYRINAHLDAASPGIGAHVDQYTTPGAQSLIAATPGALTADADTAEIPLTFQPRLDTAVGAAFVPAGTAFIDHVDVGLAHGDWARLGGRPVPIVADGVLYGPFAQKPAETEAVPADAPVAGRASLVLTGPGRYDSPGTVVASRPGYYSWVWTVDRNAQTEAGRYLEADLRTSFGRAAETSVVPFQPIASSRVSEPVLSPGDRGTDTLHVGVQDGDWLRRPAADSSNDAQSFVPVVFVGRVYEVAGDRPPVSGDAVPADATLLATVRLTATGPGDYTSPPVVLPHAGFAVWVWSVTLAEQEADVRPYLAGEWRDHWAPADEVTRVRVPTAALAWTGVESPVWIVLPAAALLLGGMVALVVGRLPRRERSRA